MWNRRVRRNGKREVNLSAGGPKTKFGTLASRLGHTRDMHEMISHAEECVMWESTLFWGLIVASLTNVLFLCVYL